GRGGTGGRNMEAAVLRRFGKSPRCEEFPDHTPRGWADIHAGKGRLVGTYRSRVGAGLPLCRLPVLAEAACHRRHLWSRRAGGWSALAACAPCGAMSEIEAFQPHFRCPTRHGVDATTAAAV